MTDRILVTVSGSAGVGKDSVVQEALPRLRELGIEWVPGVVTRDPRPTDDPAGYRYVDRETFLHLINDSGIMEYAEVQGEMYGTPSDAFEAGERGGIKIVTVDGVKSIRAWMADHDIQVSMIFSIYLTATDLTVRSRLRRRGWDDDRIDDRLSFDMPGYGPHGVSWEDCGIWNMVLDNGLWGAEVAAGILASAVEVLLCLQSPSRSIRGTSGGSTTSALDSPSDSETRGCSRRPVRGLWPPPEGSGSTPGHPPRS